MDGVGSVIEIRCVTASFPTGGSVDLLVQTVFGSASLSGAYNYVRCVDVPAGDCFACISHQATCGLCTGAGACGISSTCGDFVQGCAEVTSFVPTSGATLGGTAVTVTGSSFTSVAAGGLQCRFGAILSPVTVFNDTALTCESPSVGGPGAVSFTLLYAGVPFDASLDAEFTYYSCDDSSSTTSCGACISDEPLECGWCTFSGACSSSCPGSLVFANALCPMVSGVLPAAIPSAVCLEAMRLTISECVCWCGVFCGCVVV